MNKSLAFLVVLITILSSAACAYADNVPSITVGVSQSSEPDYIDDDPVRHRSQAKKFYAR